MDDPVVEAEREYLCEKRTIAPDGSTLADIAIETSIVALFVSVPLFLVTRIPFERYALTTHRIGEAIAAGAAERNAPMEFLRLGLFVLAAYVLYMACLLAAHVVPGAVVAASEAASANGEPLFGLRRAMRHVYAVREPLALVGGLGLATVLAAGVLYAPGTGRIGADTGSTLEALLTSLAFASFVWAAARVVRELVVYGFFMKAYAERIRASNAALAVVRRVYASACRGTLLDVDMRGCALDIMSREETSANADLGTDDRCAAIASEVFERLAVARADGVRVVTQEQLAPFFEGDGAARAFDVFDVSGSAEATAADVSAALLAVAEERANIRAAVRSSRRIVKKLDRVLMVIAALLAAVFVAVRVNMSTTGVVVTLALLVGGVDWALARSFEEMLTALLFVFGAHPFDVGDHVVVGSISSRGGVRMRVRDLDLYRTVFECDDGTLAYRTNSSLSRLPVCNLRRTRAHWHAAEAVLAKGADAADAAGRLRDGLALFCGGKPKEYTGAVVLDEVRVQADGGVHVRLLVGLPCDPHSRPGRAQCAKALDEHLQTLLSA